MTQASLIECPNDMIPLKFRRMSGLAQYAFRVRAVGRTLIGKSAAEHESRLPCCILLNDEMCGVLIPDREYPAVTEALALVARSDGETALAERYMNIHKAHECVVERRDPDASALRHALAHARAVLSRRVTVETLKKLIGSTELDLTVYRHRREYYRCLARMLIAVDSAVMGTLVARWDQLPKSNWSEIGYHAVRLF